MTRFAAAALAAFFALPAAIGAAHEHGVVIRDAYARATAPGAGASAAYMTIENHAAAPNRLLSASADVSARVELHEHILDNGVAKMREVAGGIVAPANGVVVLEPGGLHVMFLGLNRQLTPGERIPVTLTFETGGPEVVEVEVRDLSHGAPEAGHGAHGGTAAPSN
jgi:copper(I)-binding protein